MKMKMYNEEYKQWFINVREENELPVSLARQTFVRVRNTEEKLDKDCFNFNFFEILDMYKAWNIRSLNSLTNINSILKTYTDWAMGENMVTDAQNHYSEVSVDQMRECVNVTAIRKRLLNRKEVLQYARSSILQNDVERFLLLALFEGIGGGDGTDGLKCRYSELSYLTLDDIDHETRTAHLCTGRDVKMSDELYHLAIRAGNDYEFISSKGYKYKLTGNEIVKPKTTTTVDTDKTRARRIQNCLKAVFDTLGISEWMDGGALLDSGHIQWLREQKEKYNVDPIVFTLSPKGENEYTDIFKKKFGTVKCNAWYEQHKEYL